MKLLIIADDFTGALDTGIQFVTFGANVNVLLGQQNSNINNCSVQIIDTETRHRTPNEAYQIVKHCVDWGRKNGFTHIYKKTDSALRGNVGIELQALLDNSDNNKVVFAPAYPRVGRITKYGIQYVNNVPVAKSIFGNDPFEPVHHSRVSNIIHETSNAEVCEIKADNLDQIREKTGIQIVDAETDEDLNILAQWCSKQNIAYLSGCAGFAGALTRAYQLKGTFSEDPLLSHEILAVCGSKNPTSIQQMNLAEEAGYPHVRLKQEQLINTDYLKSTQALQDIDDWSNEVTCKKMLLLDVNAKQTDEQNGNNSFQDSIVGCKIAQNLAELVKRILDAGIKPTLYCTGGDTLMAIINALGVTKMTLIKEMLPGVVLSRVYYKDIPYYVISKSGGFGATDLLLQLREMIK